MTYHISKYHAGEEVPILQKKKRSAESSESDTRGSKASKVQTALPIVRQMQNQSQEQLNVIFVDNVILKMGLPVFMADNEGFRKVSATRKSCPQCCCVSITTSCIDL